MKWSSPDDWGSIDLTGHCRVWTQDQDGTQRRMQNRSKVWQVESAALNHLEGRTPRMLFGQAFDATSVTACNSSPTFTAMWIDNVVNARSREYRILALPRHSEIYNTNTAADAWTNAASSTNAVFQDFSPNPLFPGAAYRTFSCARGGASNAVATEAIGTSNGLSIVDFVCQEDSINTFDSDISHDFVFPYAATPGAKIVTGVLEDLRSKFHKLRMGQNRLMFCFLGIGESNAYGEISTGVGGFQTGSTTYVNMLDQTVTTRTATSPGVTVPGYRSGVGQSNSAGVQIYALARHIADGDDGYIKVIGPTHVASNEVEIAITDDVATWYSSGPVQLNTESVDGTDTTTACNKLDLHFLAGTGSSIYVYVLLGFSLQT